MHIIWYYHMSYNIDYRILYIIIIKYKNKNVYLIHLNYNFKDSE